MPGARIRNTSSGPCSAGAGWWGYQRLEDYNLEQAGFGYYQVNQFRGRRWSPYEAYLARARRFSDLRLFERFDPPRWAQIAALLRTGLPIGVTVVDSVGISAY